MAGECFKIPTLLEFINAWNSLFAHSAKAQFCWKEFCRMSTPSYYPMRWWSKWEVMKASLGIYSHFSGHKMIFLKPLKAACHCFGSNKECPPQGRACSSGGWRGESCEVTYKLEGDGPLALSAYELVNTILASTTVSYFPNVDAVARQLCPANPTCHQQWVAYALQCFQPGFDYLTHVLPLL